MTGTSVLSAATCDPSLGLYPSPGATGPDPNGAAFCLSSVNVAQVDPLAYGAVGLGLGLVVALLAALVVASMRRAA